MNAIYNISFGICLIILGILVNSIILRRYPESAYSVPPAYSWKRFTPLIIISIFLLGIFLIVIGLFQIPWPHTED